MTTLVTQPPKCQFSWCRIVLFSFLIILTGIYSITVKSQTWINKNPSLYPDVRAGHQLSYLTDNKILLFGGGYQGDIDMNDSWIYDVGSNSWQKLSPATHPSARRFHAMANIGNNKVLLFGGVQGYSDQAIYYSDTWLFDGNNNTWSLLSPASKPAARYFHAMAYMGDDKVLLIGGSSGLYPGDYKNDTWIFDISDNTWVQKYPTSSPPGRFSFAMTRIGSGKALIMGGEIGKYQGWPVHAKDTWIYDLATNTWTQKSSPSSWWGYSCHSMAFLGGTKAMLFGGIYNDPMSQYWIPLDDTWIYDLANDSWSEVLNTPSPGELNHHALAETHAGGGDIVLFGGSLWGAGLSKETWIFQNLIVGLTLTSPNGGENWVVGSSHNITWTSSGTSGNVQIEYSISLGKSWTNITTSTPDDGSYTWTIPNTPSTYCLVRVIDADGSPTDISDSDFSIITGTGGPCINETFPAATGTITDNSGASDYQNNMTCEKLIQPTGGGTITLTFTAFSTEASYDLVRVYAGSTTSAPLLGTFSGSTLPPVLTSSGGSMLIRFTTDGSVVAAGWSATYTSGPPPPTGCINETFTAASGTITDNSGSSDYQNNMTCEKLIQPSGGGAITLTFTAFSTEASYDLVRVYAGSTTSAPLLGTFSGSTLPPVLTSSAGSMLLRFTTDGSVVAAGWSATYGSPPPTVCINETFTAASGTITDNSGASDYQNNMTCEKLIQPTGGGTITLTFTSFATESGYDFVRVYAGSTTSAPLLGTFSGSSLPPVLTSSAGSMLIRFTTDGSVVAAGWSATYGSPPPTGCINETFTTASGTITDNSGASDYQNNMTCEKLIQPSGGETITLTFTSFATESGYDLVRVYAGSTTSAPLLGTFSGSSLPPVLTSGAGSMLIRFTTDYSVVAAGWSATYISSPPPSGCINETFTTTSGIISDNSGSSNYQNNMTCEKLIQPTGGGPIVLTFTSFATESGYDFVRVYAGTTTSAPLLGTFSGSSLPPSLTSSGGSMLIRFTTDGSVVAAGWSAIYTPGDVYIGCLNQTFTAASGTITDNSGELVYLNNMTCEKLIQPSGGGTITLTFTSFSTESGYDLVRVYGGSTTSAPLLGTFSGSSLPPVLTSSAGSMLIRFTTDYSVVAAGWIATYTASLTGGKGAEEISEKEILQDTKLVAYPNPTSGILTVESSFAEEETYTIELINTSGQVILNQKINIIGGKFDIDISDVSSGLYLLQIRTGRTVQSIRVIKN